MMLDLPLSEVHVYFSPEVRPDTPLKTLARIWSEIQKNIHNDIVLVLQKPFSVRKTPGDYVKSRNIEIRQLALVSGEARKFATLIKILKVLITNLLTRKQTTKRDIYYQDVALFQKSQTYVNEILDCISYSLHLSMEDDLGIFASQKGMLFSQIPLAEGDTVFTFDTPTLIPRFHDIKLLGCPDAVIILEKEAIFKSFCQFVKEKNLNYLVITGKGFPDRLTRNFVTYLSKEYKNLAFLGFVDADVYGINILKTYKYSLGFSVPQCPQLRLAGVHLLEYRDGWQDLSMRDWKMTSNFINKVKTNCHGTHLEKCEVKLWHRELTRSLVLFKKSEINVISNDPNQYIFDKIKCLMSQHSVTARHMQI
ncbi:Piso0_000719 [Millerozyma farinosa CBS 7064]|uniref:DNA topoisomerase (ATP-hydrolyzing) n=1 Tax=Pichia sorbitophila (strain ATCC MYA-4447 / BCRC 22081 / CBS 7064 / NBRC 10061 / NRRL Y-12695) TaxID=559304 RepID=G8YRB9_PICSO|nr:Piso0_000719 [Millerozyma farinosa CBS 7064]